MIVTLPLPRVITQYYPTRLVSFLQWFGFWSFAALLILPWLFCTYRLVTHSIGRTKRIKGALGDHTAPKAVVVMPVYKEDPAVLVKAIDSVVDSDYPRNCIHVFLSYDGVAVDETYLRVIHRLGISIALETYPQSIDVVYKGVRITVSRFEHGGKRNCQKQTFKLIDKVYSDYIQYKDDLFMLFIDSDCVLDKFCLQNFLYDMELKPGSKHNMLAMTGVITSTTERNSLITVLQDVEYVHGQLFERSVESACGAVTCLPGALTMLRFSAFRKMAKYYFADNGDKCADLFDYAKFHLGEDRLLTHLFMIGAREPYQIQMCTSAFCKTEAVQTFRSLIKQRRRWFLGYITNEVCMLTDIRLWKRYPLLCIMRFMQNTIRTTALLFFIMVISIMTTSSKVKDLPVGFIAISLGLNYALMLYFGLKLRRFKAWLYPLVFVLNPFFNWLYMIYGIFTAGQRTWGGPRADAATGQSNGKPDEEVAVQIDPDSTGQYIKVPSNEEKEARRLPIHPAEKLNRRLASSMPSSKTTSGSSVGRLLTDESQSSFRHIDSLELSTRYDSGRDSIFLSQDIENLMGEEDVAKRHIAIQMRLQEDEPRESDTGYRGEAPSLHPRRQSYCDSIRAGSFKAPSLPHPRQSESSTARPIVNDVSPQQSTIPPIYDVRTEDVPHLQHPQRKRLRKKPKRMNLAQQGDMV